MSGGVSSSNTGASRPERTARTIHTSGARGRVRIGLLLLAVFVAAWAAIAVVGAPSQVPPVWPAGGLVAGLLLTSPRRMRRGLLVVCLLLIVSAYLVHGYDLVPSLGFSLSFVAGAWVTRTRLVSGLDGRRAVLRDSGDVSRFIGAVTVGSLLAAAGYGLTDRLVGEGDPLLGALGAFGANAAALTVLLPLFLEALDFEPIAGTRERAVQAALTVGTTIAIFLFTDIPPVVFAVMPMFAWHAYRGTLREATVLLMVVATIGSVASVWEVGPIWGLGARYDLPPEIVAGVLQLFLLDCALILLPLSVLVTQQRMSAARADAERETLRRLVESATGTAIISLALDGSVSLFNPGAELMLGYSEAEVLGKHTHMFHPRGELRRQARALGVEQNFPDMCHAAAQSRVSHLWRFVRKDGEERVLRMRLNAVVDENAELSGYLATAEDVTEREAAQRALLLTMQHQRTAVKRLQELERVKGDFVATVSHELRTPITSIIGYTELLEDGAVGELTQPQSEIIDRVDRNGRRLLVLVEDLLTLSQIESSSLRMEAAVIDLRQVVCRARDGLEELLQGRTLDLNVSVPQERVVHHGDPVQLRRMVSNLLTNAVKFTPDGGSVQLELSSSGEQNQIVVTDDGVGMTDEDQTRLFARFFRSTSSFDQAVQGAGLGLTIVHAIVALHGGEVAVSSAQGRGTTVTVSLPRTVGSVTSVAASERPTGRVIA